MKHSTSLRAINLRTGNMVNPLGIGLRPPELSWQLDSPLPEQQATAWQIIAADSPEKLLSGPYLYDSNKQTTPAMHSHLYGGPPLACRDRVFWQVRLWNENDQPGEWSNIASFEVGLCTEDSWEAQYAAFPAGWSGHALYYQKRFTVKKNVKFARCYIQTPSWCEAWINGCKLGGKAVLQPPQTNYRKSCHYLAYDITNILQLGENVLALHVGSGWYGMPVVRYQLEADGKVITRSHAIDDRPTVWPSPVCRNSVFGGEEFDAGLEIDPSWKLPGGCNLPVGRPAFFVPGPSGSPRYVEEEPIMPQEELKPVSYERLGQGHYSVDFGRNFAGYCRLRVKAPAGTRIEMIYSEVRYPDKTANQENLMGDRAIDIYTTAGHDDYEIFEPHFTYHGFRYVELRNFPGIPDSDTLTGIVLRNDCRDTGIFSCSNGLFNRIFNMIKNTEASNLHGVPTDCPQRTERMGWLNDMMARCEGALYLFDESNLLTKYLHDIAEAQDPITGNVPMTAPCFWEYDVDPVCSSFIETALLNYAFYGKKDLLKELYGNFRSWVDYLIKCCDKDGILRRGGEIGDWCPPLAFNHGVNTAQNMTVPHELVATALTAYSVQMLSKITGILDLHNEKRELEQRHNKLIQDFQREFCCAPGRLTPESQSAYAYAIYCGLFPPEENQLAADRLAELFRQNNYKPSTGNIGSKYLLEVLTRFGYGEYVWIFLNSTDYPGYGYMLSHGATTLWERWELAEGGGMNSHNHPMLGAPGVWFFRHLAGIQILEDTAGFDRFALKPCFIRQIDHVNAQYASRAGVIKVNYQRTEHGIVYNFTIPSGCQAQVKMPDGSEKIFNGGTHQLIFNQPISKEKITNV